MSQEQTKSLGLRIKGAGTPTEGQLTAIRQYTLADMPAEQLYVRSFVLAHNCIDRDNEAFDEGLLNNFASTLIGKGAYIKHPSGWDGDSGPAEGRWFATNLQTMSLAEARTFLREPALQLPPDRSMVTILMGDAYFAKTADNAALLTKLDAGIAGDVSIGFCYDHPETIKDPNNGLELQANRLMGPGEAREASLVWLGAQPGARAVKSAQRQTNSTEDTAMDLKEVQTQLEAANNKIKTLQPSADFHTSLKTALGKDHAALADNADLLAKAVVAGAKYKASLIDTLIAHERQKGVLGDAPAEVEEAKASYAQLGIDHLQRLVTAAEKSAGTEKPGTPAAQLRGGDPNARTTDNKSADTKDTPLEGCLQLDE